MVLSVEAQWVGQTLRCPGSGQDFAVSGVAPGAPPPAAPANPPPPQAPPPPRFGEMVGRRLQDPDNLPISLVPNPQAEAEERLRRGPQDYFPAPPVRRRKRRRDGIMARLDRFWGFTCLAGLIIGGVMVFLGWQDLRLRNRGSDTPQELALADLAARGPGGNVHVRVHGFQPGVKYVIQKKGQSWNAVWIPLFPPDGPRTEARVIVKSLRVSNDAEANALAARADLTGIVSESPGALGAKEQSELEKHYPGVNFSSAYVLEEGKYFPEETRVILVFGGGLVLVSIGLLTGLFWIIFHRR
jgi:hypothetical protein